MEEKTKKGKRKQGSRERERGTGGNKDANAFQSTLETTHTQGGVLISCCNYGSILVFISLLAVLPDQTLSSTLVFGLSLARVVHMHEAAHANDV